MPSTLKIDITELSVLRQEMDRIDEVLVLNLVRRYEKAAEILAWKTKHNLPLHAPEREWRIIQRAVKNARQFGFDHEKDSFIRMIFFLLLGHPFTKYYQHHYWTE